MQTVSRHMKSRTPQYISEKWKFLNFFLKKPLFCIINAYFCLNKLKSSKTNIYGIGKI
jgi:hypothetical protein